MDSQQSRWEADGVVRLYPVLARWLFLGLAVTVAAVALLSGSVGAATFLLVFALILGILGTVYAWSARALDAIELAPNGASLILIRNSQPETVELSRVRRVHFSNYGAVITIVTLAPRRQYMISLLDERRSSFWYALKDAGLLVSSDWRPPA